MTGEKNIYAEPRDITNINQCFFYHTIDIPGHGTMEGSWDLRDSVNDYMGNVEFKGKKVMEMGPADGFLSFEMEKMGADVVSFDLSKDYDWDIIPFAQYDYQRVLENRKQEIDKLNNAYWCCHRVLNSRTKVIYGNVYHLPDEIGEVDIVTYGAILLHLRDPFLALQQGLRFARETVIITEPLRNQLIKFKQPYMKFLPDPKTIEPKAVWWDLRPEIIVRMIGVLGFEDSRVTSHTYRREGKPVLMYTVVGQRTQGLPGITGRPG
jgi:hypothetical protein